MPHQSQSIDIVSISPSLCIFLYNNTWLSLTTDNGANRLVEEPGSLDDAVRLLVGISALITDVIRNSPSKGGAFEQLA
jgi:hypothetical protein